MKTTKKTNVSLQMSIKVFFRYSAFGSSVCVYDDASKMASTANADLYYDTGAFLLHQDVLLNSRDIL
jgi:hypothetical protein